VNRKTSFAPFLTALLLVIPWLVIAAGCGPSRPEVAKVKGKVTFQGKPVTSGQVIFWPETGRSARGKINPDGTYILTTFDSEDGAVLGNHIVTIEAIKVFDNEPKPTSLEEEIRMGREGKLGTGQATVQHLIPPKYSNRETSGLKAEVKSGENTLDFPL